MISTTILPNEEKLAALFNQLSLPARIQILIIIREQPACVCHLVAALGLRQATISQHLMALREAGWVSIQKEGRYIFYSLSDIRLIKLIKQAAAIANISYNEIEKISHRPLANCPCPHCNPDLLIE
ncbi:MAG: winged helix-turn-helix transcriptional regulator [Anaerolineales bacterium]|nr:winged helix-turn-helix transcriptional regulator [Anaerolineales bacterium]